SPLWTATSAGRPTAGTPVHVAALAPHPRERMRRWASSWSTWGGLLLLPWQRPTLPALFAGLERTSTRPRSDSWRPPTPPPLPGATAGALDRIVHENARHDGLVRAARNRRRDVVQPRQPSWAIEWHRWNDRDRRRSVDGRSQLHRRVQLDGGVEL